MANWWEEKDEFGYTYADKNRPGYMGPVPKEEEVQAPEEEVEGFHEDFYEEDEVSEDDKSFVQKEFMDVELTEEQKKLSKVLEEEKSPDVGLPKEEPQILKEVDVGAEKNIKSLMKKALGAKGKQRSDGYANLYKALEAYKGKETPFIKGLKSRFSKKASDTKNKRHLGDYVDYFKQGYSWQASSPRRASSPSRTSVPAINEYSNTIEYDQESILENANNFKDGLKIPGSSARTWAERMRHRPKILIGDDQYVLTSNHMEEGGHSMKDSRRSSQLLLKNGKIVKHPDGRFNYGLDLIGNQGKIKNILSGKIHKIDEKDENGNYPTGYGKRLIVKTDKIIEVDGKQYPLFVHYAHATGDSFDDLNVGDSLEPGQEIGTMGKTSKSGPSRTMGVHLDLNGYIMKDGKKVYVSPSEFLPMGPEEHRTRKGFQEGGEVYDEGEEGKVFADRGRVARMLGKNPERGEYRVRGGGGKTKAFDRLSEEAKQLPFKVGSDFVKRDPDKKDQDYYGVGVEGGWEKFRESEDGEQREVSKDVLKIRDPLFRLKYRRNPKTGKVEKYVEAEEDAPWHEGGAFPRRRSISIAGGGRKGDFDIPEASKFRDRETAERLSKISPYERLEGEGMSYGRDSAEFGTELHDSPRSFKDMPKKSRKGLRRMAQYGDAGDLELRYFGEAFNKADKAGKAKLAKANPELAKEYKQHMGFQEGGEVEDVGYNFEDFGSGQDYIDDMSERDDFGYSYAETQRPGYMQRPPEVREDVEFEVEDVVNRPVEAPPVDTSLDEQRQNMRRAEAEEFQRQQEIEESKKQPNLIEESRAKVEEFQGPDAEMVRKSYSEIEANIDDVDPRTGKLSLEAKQYLAQIPRQTLMDYRNTYAADADKPKLNDLIVQQESILKEVDKADSIKVGQRPKPPVRRVSELDFLKIRALKDEEDVRKAETEMIAQAMKQSAIDPKRFYKNQSTFDKVVSLIGLAAGAYGSIKYGGPNYYLEQMDKEVEKDIKAQKLEQEVEKRKLAAHQFKVSTLAKRLARSSANVKNRQNLLKIAQTAALKGQKILKKEVKEKKKMADLATLNRRGISSNELAYLMAKYPDLKLQESLITARDGKHYYIMGGKQAVKKIKESLADTQDSIDGLRDLEGYVDKVGIWNQGWAPWSFLSRDRAEAEALRDRLVGKLRIEFFGPGVMTDNEREQAKKILGDPNAFFTTDEREKAKIRSLIMKLNYGMRQKLRRDGLTMLPLSPNENRVKQLLQKNNLGDNPKNRVKIVDSLIEAEKEAVLGGGKSGQFWDMNEPLPI